ncbi:MAG: hypothetical protein HQK83_01195 [Fibrobacteria bacterium]|nr:hypothetical protein [Fibrobacteria bacterium]
MGDKSNIPLVSSNSPGFSHYVAGLNAVIESEQELAIELLTRSVELDSDLYDAFYQLGKLYTKKDELLRAQKIFSDLLLREGLSKDFINKVEIALIEVYTLRKKLKKAQALAELRVSKYPDDSEARLSLTTLLEKQGDFKSAQKHWEVYAKLTQITSKHRLALYKVELARNLKSLTEKDKRDYYQQALKMDEKCAPAYILLARIFRKQKKDKKVLEIWNAFLENIPEKSPWIFNEMENYLYEINRYHELLGIYQGLVRKAGPHKTASQLALARQYYKIGKKDLAHETIVSVLEEPENKEFALKELIRYYLEVEKNEATLSKIHSLLTEYVERKSFSCQKCGALSKEAEWHCSECGAWDSYAP